MLFYSSREDVICIMIFGVPCGSRLPQCMQRRLLFLFQNKLPKIRFHFMFFPKFGNQLQLRLFHCVFRSSAVFQSSVLFSTQIRVFHIYAVFRSVQSRRSSQQSSSDKPNFPIDTSQKHGTGLLQCMSVCSSDILWLGLKKSGREKSLCSFNTKKTSLSFFSAYVLDMNPFAFLLIAFEIRHFGTGLL